jgi:hypothetical protein
MRSIAFTTIARDLRAYVDLAASGEVVRVIDNDRVVVELRPPASKQLVEDPVLARLVRNGQARPPTLPSGIAPKRVPLLKLEEILADQDHDREDH